MADPLAFGVDLTGVRQRFEALGYFLSVTDILEAAEALDEEYGVFGHPPAAFVAVTQERAQPNQRIGGHLQKIEVEIGVLFVESAIRADHQGRDALERTRKAVIRQGIAWTPVGAQHGLEYRGYRVVSLGNGLAWGEVTFGTTYLLSASS